MKNIFLKFLLTFLIVGCIIFATFTKEAVTMMNKNYYYFYYFNMDCPFFAKSK